MKSTADQTLTYNFDIEIMEVDQDNVAELSINISSISFNGNINGEKINYDSKATLSRQTKINLENLRLL